MLNISCDLDRPFCPSKIDLPTEKSIGRLISQVKSLLGDWSPNWKVHWEIDLPTEKSIRRLISQLKSPFRDWSLKKVQKDQGLSRLRATDTVQCCRGEGSRLPEKAVREHLGLQAYLTVSEAVNDHYHQGETIKQREKVYYGVWEMKLRPAGKVQADRGNA